MIFPLVSRKRSKRDRMFLMTGLSPGPCRSQPSACISTMIRPVCSGESSTVRPSSTTNLRSSGSLSILVHRVIEWVDFVLKGLQTSIETDHETLESGQKAGMVLQWQHQGNECGGYGTRMHS